MRSGQLGRPARARCASEAQALAAGPVQVLQDDQHRRLAAAEEALDHREQPRRARPRDRSRRARGPRARGARRCRAPPPGARRPRGRRRRRASTSRAAPRGRRGRARRPRSPPARAARPRPRPARARAARRAGATCPRRSRRPRARRRPWPVDRRREHLGELAELLVAPHELRRLEEALARGRRLHLERLPGARAERGEDLVDAGRAARRARFSSRRAHHRRQARVDAAERSGTLCEDVARAARKTSLMSNG